ncbi:lipopolysaccharide export system protein LptC [Desulfocicer vacuolatum DSM 3385]|uniref:Lipopolysaccharide export system protein LptC n=2 Tax=Desulfocicer vacuolatum TaxID=2298 RepID=A0A1W2CEM0_9BACT|nr:lipopolysaccharide export system protein LptC [Desulfocicer vacuolatum DSM 3385]
MTSGLKGRNRLLFILAIAMGCVVAALFSIYFVNRITSKEPVAKNITIDSKTLVALGAMRQTSTRNGIKEWTLDAESARILKEKNLAVLEDVSVFFFLTNGEKIHLTSRSGTIDTKQHDISLSDTVVVRHLDQILETDRLQYEKKRHIIYSITPVTITTPRAKLTADRLTMDLNENVVQLKGNFEGFF